MSFGAKGQSQIFVPQTGVASYDALRSSQPLTARGYFDGGFSVVHQEQVAARTEQDVPAVADTVVFVHLRASPSLRATMDGRDFDAIGPAGTAVLMPPGTPSRWLIDAGEGEVLHMHLTPALVGQLLPEHLPDGRFAFAPRGGVRDETIGRLARACLDELRTPGPASRLLMQSHALALTVHLLRAYSGDHSQPQHFATAPFRIQRVRDYIEANLGRDVALDELAEVAGLSVAHFARAFKAMTGNTPYRYLVLRRVEYAKRLMLDGERALAEIALDCGFASQQHFTRQFAQIVGMPPGRWRQRAQW
ncbi:MAG: hypothetical protein A4S12_02175 [Proteobacteria bacterium SG_bin5]|nr:AraC family transcriptional regulator [Sphingomonas sp.]OQW39683.1 MAG: hypothetical protein A4S12_02175 [Proteobacteria bacterium SG_bin5]